MNAGFGCHIGNGGSKALVKGTMYSSMECGMPPSLSVEFTLSFGNGLPLRQAARAGLVEQWAEQLKFWLWGGRVISFCYLFVVHFDKLSARVVGRFMVV